MTQGVPMSMTIADRASLLELGSVKWSWVDALKESAKGRSSWSVRAREAGPLNAKMRV